MTTTQPASPAPSVNDAIVDYVGKMSRCSFTELFEIFGPDNVGPERARKSFIELLRCLSSSHKIAILGRQDKGYSLDNLVITLPPEVVPDVEGQAPVAPIRTQAPQYDAMHGDAYVHVLPPPTRPGSLDFQRYRSHGYLC